VRKEERKRVEESKKGKGKKRERAVRESSVKEG
jgi:hypothetical protein